MVYLLVFIVAFLVGSVPTGYLIGKFIFGVDVREHGSKNLGATNVMRVLGRTPGFVCLILDVCKGTIPVVLLAHGRVDYQIVVAVSAVAGHCFTPWMGWKGGKGVATALGALAAIAPLQTLWTFAICAMLIAATAYVSIGSIVGAVLFPVFVYFSDLNVGVFYLAVVVGAVLLIRHRTNIERLFNGEEKTFWSGSEKSSCQSCTVADDVPDEPLEVDIVLDDEEV